MLKYHNIIPSSSGHLETRSDTAVIVPSTFCTLKKESMEKYSIATTLIIKSMNSTSKTE